MNPFEEKLIPTDWPLTCDCGRPVEHFASSHTWCRKLEERLYKQRDELLVDMRELLSFHEAGHHIGISIMARMRKKWGVK